MASTNGPPDFFRNLNEQVNLNSPLQSPASQLDWICQSLCCRVPIDLLHFDVGIWHWPEKMLLSQHLTHPRTGCGETGWLQARFCARWWICMDWQFSGSRILANFWHLKGFQCFFELYTKISICIYWLCSLRQSRHRLWLLPADEGHHWCRPCHREGAESFASPICEILRSSDSPPRREEKLKAPRLLILTSTSSRDKTFKMLLHISSHLRMFGCPWMILNVSILLNTYLHCAHICSCSELWAASMLPGSRHSEWRCVLSC